MRLIDAVSLPTNSAIKIAALSVYGVAILSQLVMRQEVESAELVLLPTASDLSLVRPLKAIWRAISGNVHLVERLVGEARSCLATIGCGLYEGRG